MILGSALLGLSWDWSQSDKGTRCTSRESMQVSTYNRPRPKSNPLSSYLPPTIPTLWGSFVRNTRLGRCRKRSRNWMIGGRRSGVKLWSEMRLIAPFVLIRWTLRSLCCSRAVTSFIMTALRTSRNLSWRLNRLTMRAWAHISSSVVVRCVAREATRKSRLNFDLNGN